MTDTKMKSTQVQASEETEKSVNVQKMSLAELKAAAKQRGIAVSAAIKKAELLALLENSTAAAPKEAKSASRKENKTAPADKSSVAPAKENKAVPAEEKQVAEAGVKKRGRKKADAAGTEAAKPEAAKPEAAKPEARNVEAAKPEAAKPEAVKPEAAKPEAKNVEAAKPVVNELPIKAQERTESKEKKYVHTKKESLPEDAGKAPEVQDKAVSQPVQALQATKAASQTQGTEQGQNTARPIRKPELEHLDSGIMKEGILEIMPDGYGFIRCDNYLPGENDVYVAPTQIRRLNLKTGDIVCGNVKIRSQNEKFSALLYVRSVNGYPTAEASRRKRFEDLTPIFPNERLHLEMPGCGISMRMVDLISPIGKGQRGMIVSQPKAGKTTLLKQIAKSMKSNHPEIHLIILLIDERPEEVTDMKESIEGENVEVIYSTFDELPENHKRVSEMVIERAKRLVEHKRDVVILLDSITRLARAYNLTVQASGRTLSGGLDPAALHMPKRFFGAARNMREGGSLTILATALVETGSRMDDVVFEEFKGTGNMELVLDRSLSEKRIFPAIDLPKSSTRRDDLLLSPGEMEANFLMRRALNSSRSDDAVERIISMFSQTKTNNDFIDLVRRTRIV